MDPVALTYDYISEFDPKVSIRVADTLRTPHIIRCRIGGERVIILRIHQAARRPTTP